MPPGAARIAGLLIDSYHRAAGMALCLPESAEALWHLPLPVVAHGTEADPIFSYANAAALALWQMDWDAFTRLPSRRSAEAEPGIQADRSALLARALAEGIVRDYQGIRISAQGHRFRIADTHLWTVTDAGGTRHGQAARIGRVIPLA